jgi:sugar phosphate isomerase/epimerase
MIPAIWTSILADMPLHEALAELHACGWRAFEISSEHLVTLETDANGDVLIRKALECRDRLGLSLPQAHGFLGADMAHPDAAQREEHLRRLRRHIGIAAQLGVRCVVVHPGGRRGLTPLEQADVNRLNIAACRGLGDFAGPCGVRIGLENLMRPGATTSAEMLALLEAVNHPALGITLDTSHAHRSGLVVADMVRAFGARMIGTHISDNDGSEDQHLTPGQGTIDWPAVMQAFGEVRYEGLFNLEIPGERHRVAALRELKIRHACSVAHWLVSLSGNRT